MVQTLSFPVCVCIMKYSGTLLALCIVTSTVDVGVDGLETTSEVEGALASYSCVDFLF